VALISCRALVLQVFPYSETSKILRLYTLEHGLRSVLARGALRPRSRFGGLLEPFTEGTAALHLRDGRDLHNLSGFDLIRSRQALGRTLVGFSAASLQAEIVLRTATEEPHPALFHTILDAWDALARTPPAGDALAIALTGVWTLVALQGLEPETASCVRCGRPLGGAEEARFDAAGGGVVCLGCRPEGRLLGPSARAELRALSSGLPPASIASPGAQRALLRAFLDAHFTADRPLRALDLFLESTGGLPADRDVTGGGGVA
jgi:DNA repair protein RecO (recombination protein O)